MAAAETEDIEINLEQEQVPEAEPAQEQQPGPITDSAPAEPEPALTAIPGSAPPEPATLPAQSEPQLSQAAFQTLPTLQYVHPTYQGASFTAQMQGAVVEPPKGPINSVDQEAAADLAALRQNIAGKPSDQELTAATQAANTSLPSQQLQQLSQQQLLEAQAAQIPIDPAYLHALAQQQAAFQAQQHAALHAQAQLQAQAQGQTQGLAPAASGQTGVKSGRTPSKRKAWKASHVGGDNAEVNVDGVERTESGRARRKQTRRPDRLCHFEGCFVTPTYNYPGEKKRIYCVGHKLEGMVNVVAKRCAHPDCKVNPRFNFPGNVRGQYCSEHKLEGMINVIDRRCVEPECQKFPSHNYPGQHKKLYCASHKKEGMIDMSHGS